MSLGQRKSIIVARSQVGCLLHNDAVPSSKETNLLLLKLIKSLLGQPEILDRGEDPHGLITSRTKLRERFHETKDESNRLVHMLLQDK